MNCVICHPRNDDQIIPKFVYCPRCGKDYPTRKNGDIVVRFQAVWYEIISHCNMPNCRGKTNTKLK